VVETTFNTAVQEQVQEQVAQFCAKIVRERVTNHGLVLYELVVPPLSHLCSDG
jgi:hypothetical protein